MMQAIFFTNPRTKCNTVKHAVFLEKTAAKIKLANSNIMARWVTE